MREARIARQNGNRLLDENGQDAELIAPFTLACAFDGTFQRAILNATEFVPTGEEARNGDGLPEEVFEEAWMQAAMSMSTLISEATGASQEEVEQALHSNNSDCSVTLFSLLHDNGDAFQRQCMEANAIELSRRRQERTLSTVVNEAARQNCIPPDLSTKRMIRMLREHLPLTEIMGHRYRAKKGGDRERIGTNRVSFAADGLGCYLPRPSSSQHDGRKRRANQDDADESSSQSDDDDDSEDYDDEDSSVASSSRDGSDQRSDSSNRSSSEFDSSDSSSSESESDSDDSRKSKKRKRSTSKTRKRSGSNMVAVPPSNWIDGDPPNAGFFLETFTKIYREYKSFTKLHRNTGLAFRSLIQPCLKPTVLMELGVSSLAKLTQEELLRRIKERLGFDEEDYYTRKLELLRLPHCDQSKATALYKSFRKLSSPMLSIIKEAEDCGVKLRTTNISRIFKNQIRGWPSLERWFASRRFKNFSEAMRHISTQIHDRIAKEMEERHEDLIMRGQVAGARSDIRGGKSEAGQGGQPRQQNRIRDSGRNSGAGARPGRGSSSAPDNSRGRSSEQRSSSGGAAGSRYPNRSAGEEEAFQAAILKEKALPRGMYFHPRGPFCKENPCKAKVCQGCNYHADADGKGHIRPNCRCKDHPHFVASGYFHDAHPGQQGALSLPRRQGTTDDSGNVSHRPPPAGNVRNVTFDRRESSDRGSKKE